MTVYEKQTAVEEIVDQPVPIVVEENGQCAFDLSGWFGSVKEVRYA